MEMLEDQKDKYESNNPIANYLINNFVNSITVTIHEIKDDISSIVEAGCGDGYLTSYLLKHNVQVNKSFDISENLIELAKSKVVNFDFYTKSIYDMDKRENADLIICCEVLEHLTDPELALKKLFESANKYVILSVPNEPIWRILNFLRGKYWSSYGNTPDHINNWTPNEFKALVKKEFEIIKILKPLPWTIILAKKKEVIV